MAPPPQARVLRCCRCRLFQAHQMKKSLKWTCKTCGEKQSFLRAYSEGSGADCRRHVQKLNLLQGQILEMSPRCLGEPVDADERRAGPGPAARVRVQAPAGQAGPGRGVSREDGAAGEPTGPWGEPLRPAQPLRATSKWERFLQSPGNSSHVDPEPPAPLQRDPRPAGAVQAEQRSTRAHAAEDGGPRTPSTDQLPGATQAPTPGPKGPFGETPEQLWGLGPQAGSGPSVKGAQAPGPVRLWDLFNTGEDFDDAL